MKMIFSSILFVCSLTTLSFECSNVLEATIKRKLSSEQTLVQVLFKKILAPSEKYQDHWGMRKVVINREKFPVYYFRSVVELRLKCEKSQCSPQFFHNAYLLSPNTCRILKKALLFVH
ncbi:hypothetical protein A9Q84_13255 [Halobacteriovorax marinus]|uniref:Uncharacterized protein n=1 Tax=Halobacteriovorax marinus TaxID=97084 RepID=A0A1Y5F8R6_9BACT|nr:hypothetical protein A9Q84_13255 [Halobacteriovorax marinus]